MIYGILFIDDSPVATAAGRFKGRDMHEVLIRVRGEETHKRRLSHIPSPGDCVCIRIAGEWVTLRVLSVMHNEVIEGEDLLSELACVRIAEADTDV